MDGPDELPQWVVYHDPSDYPGQYVTRRWVVGRGQIRADLDPVYVGDSLEGARAAVPLGCYRIAALVSDDHAICEVWV